MYKISIDLFKVHKYFKVKFCLVYNKENEPGNQYFSKTISKFNFAGNDYLRFNPYPFLSVDITSNMDRTEEWSSNNGFNMNRRELFLFINKLNKVYSQFTKEADLFYYDENSELKVNKILADRCKEFAICGNKTILLQPCVVEDLDHNNSYEGIFLSINSMDYFTYLTYGDIEYFLYELRHVDMTALSIALLNSVILYENKETEQTKKAQPVLENKEIEIVDKKKQIGIPKPDTIPEI